VSTSDPQLGALVLQSEEAVDTIPADACPFCDEWEETIIDPKHDARRAFLNDGQDVKPYGTLKQFRRHLGRHMEQLALFALPMAENEDLEDESASGHNEDSVDSASVQVYDDDDDDDGGGGETSVLHGDAVGNAIFTEEQNSKGESFKDSEPRKPLDLPASIPISRSRNAHLVNQKQSPPPSRSFTVSPPTQFSTPAQGSSSAVPPENQVTRSETAGKSKRTKLKAMFGIDLASSSSRRPTMPTQRSSSDLEKVLSNTTTSSIGVIPQHRPMIEVPPTSHHSGHLRTISESSVTFDKSVNQGLKSSPFSLPAIVVSDPEADFAVESTQG